MIGGADNINIMSGGCAAGSRINDQRTEALACLPACPLRWMFDFDATTAEAAAAVAVVVVGSGGGGRSSNSMNNDNGR